jgi:hypothetical protein
MMEIAHHDALGEHVDDDLRTHQQFGGQFALVRAVGADRRDEGSG